METSEIAAAMDRAIAAVGRPCYFHIADRNLIRSLEGGWWSIGTVNIPEERKAWKVYYHPETGRGWLWGMYVLAKGVQPRRFEPPGMPIVIE